MGMGWCIAAYCQESVSAGTPTQRPTSTPAPTLTPLAKEELQALRERIQRLPTMKNPNSVSHELGDIQKRGSAAAALIPDLLGILRTGVNPKEISEALRHLGPEGRATLIGLASAKEARAIRVASLWELRVLGGNRWPTDILRTFLDASSDPDEEVAGVADKLLSQNGTLGEDAAPDLLAWYRESPSPAREKTLALALGTSLELALGGTQTLVELQNDPDPAIRRAAREAFSRIIASQRTVKRDSVPLLFEIVARGDEEFYFVARSIASPGGREEGGYQQSMLESENPRQRALAVRQVSQALRPSQAIQILRKALKDPAVLVRVEAGIGLATRKMEVAASPEDRGDARSALEEGLLLYHDDSLRKDIELCLEWLRNFGATPTPILDALRSADRDTRSRAAHDLAGVTDPEMRKAAIPALLALIDGDETSTLDALKALASVGVGDPSVVPVVRDVLEGKVVRFHTEGLEALGSSFVKMAAWQTLARNNTPEAGRAVCEMLQDPGSKWNTSLYRAIAELGPNARCALPELKRLFKDTELPPPPTKQKKFNPEELRRYRRLYIAGCFGALGEENEEAIPLLMEALQDPKPYVQMAAAENIAHWGPKASEAIPVLIKLLGARRDSWQGATWLFPPRNPAVQALTSMGSAVVPALTERLGDPNHEVRASVTHVLGMLGPEAVDAAPALIQAIDSATSDSMDYAITLSRIAPTAKDTVPALLRMLRKSNHSARTEALAALGSMGPDAAEAIPELEAILANPDEEYSIRRTAREALAKIKK